MNIIGIPSLETNYIWIGYNEHSECFIVDPGESLNLLKILKKMQFHVKAILLTHDHIDHIGGIYGLISCFPKVKVYGPIETQNKGSNIIVSEGDSLFILNKKFTVFNFPGHTLNHIGFYCNPWLFCGDTLFSMGCGMISPGLAQYMYESFLKIQNFPKNTLIYSGHEYTLSNINFAMSVLPQDKCIIKYRNKIIELRKQKKPTIPTTLNLELQMNPFCRCHQINLQKSLNFYSSCGEEWKVFEKLRKRKDFFNKK